MNWKALWTHLVAEKLVTSDLPPSIDGTPDVSQAWYIRLIVGVGAWIAALLFFITLGAFNLITDASAILFVGTISSIIAIGYYRSAPSNLFLDNLMLALGILGWGMIIIGVSELFNFDDAMIALSALLVSTLLYGLLRQYLFRFLVALTIPGLILYLLIYEWGFTLAVHVVVTVCAVTIVWLWRNYWQITDELRQPLTFALPIVLAALTVYPSFILDELNYSWAESPYWRGTLMIPVALCLLWVVWELLEQYNADQTQRSGSLGLTCGLILLAIQTPALVVALLLLLLGFWQGQHLMTGLATVLFIYAVGAYYYDLSLSLFWTSITLMGSGVIMIVVSYISHRWLTGGLK